jgi:glucuronate isomerase
MTKKYLHDNFYLKSDLAVRLFHGTAKDLPVIDFHNHLNPKDLAINRKFENIADAWVLFDPYKHRAMRIAGIPENEITGSAPDKQKFLNWAGTVPKTLGNPLFVWNALELKRIFNIDEILTEKNAGEIWNECNSQLTNDGFGAVDILKKFRIETASTSDDLLDDLTFHNEATETQGIEVFPSLRGDSILNIEQIPFKLWFEKLQKYTNQHISNLDDYKIALIGQLNKFSDAGCRLADHSLDSGFQYCSPSETRASKAFERWMNGHELKSEEITQFKNYMLQFLGEEYSKQNWTLQLHIGAHRYTSSRLRKLAGSAGGYATIGVSCDIAGLCSFIDSLESARNLPRIILYTLNPADNEAFAALTGSYAEDGVPGKIQFGPGWWYNDQYEGIRKQLTGLASYGLLGQFIGMTTDSRSVFSFSRHEYFRRILCNIIAEWVENENLPNDYDLLSNLVKNISYMNSKNI